MKMLKRAMAAAATAVLVAQPVVAAAPAAQRLSLKNTAVSGVRVATKRGDQKAAAGIPLIAIIAGVAVIVGVIVIASDGNSSSP